MEFGAIKREYIREYRQSTIRKKDEIDQLESQKKFLLHELDLVEVPSVAMYFETQEMMEN